VTVNAIARVCSGTALHQRRCSITTTARGSGFLTRRPMRRGSDWVTGIPAEIRTCHEEGQANWVIVPIVALDSCIALFPGTLRQRLARCPGIRPELLHSTTGHPCNHAFFVR